MRKNVIEYLIDTAKKYPDKIALVDANKSITFAQLEHQAKRLSAVIVRQCGCIKNQPIAVYMEKSIDCIIAFMGIVYSGNFYSPIDAKMPNDRIQRILSVLQPKRIIYNTKNLDGFETDKQICLPGIEEINLSEYHIGNYRNVLDTDPVYVLFTSGSTGQPKGVVISHKSVIDYTEWLSDKFQFSEKTTFGNQAPFYFDNSILDIYSTLKNGATMNIIAEKMFLFPQRLLNYINQNNINTIFWVPSALIGVANSGALNEVFLEGIEKILFCGEVMPTKQLNLWREKYPDVLYVNLYGPTEITDVCTYYIVNREFSSEESLPIGTACENTEILVLNENNHLVQQDEIGELCVRGTSLSLGYYGDFEKTGQVFVQNPLNDKYQELIYRTGDLVKYNKYGEIIYVGRKDYQIKHQGYRIELGEIETLCSSMEEIERICAIYDDKNKKIVLFCSLKACYADITEKNIYTWLKKRLPSYMLPSVIYLKDHLPMNANGKIDRVRLKQYLDNGCEKIEETNLGYSKRDQSL